MGSAAPIDSNPSVSRLLRASVSPSLGEKPRVAFGECAGTKEAHSSAGPPRRASAQSCLPPLCVQTWTQVLWGPGVQSARPTSPARSREEGCAQVPALTGEFRRLCREIGFFAGSQCFGPGNAQNWQRLTKAAFRLRVYQLLRDKRQGLECRLLK